MNRRTQLALALALGLPPIVATTPVLAAPASVAAAPALAPRPTRLVPSFRDGESRGLRVFAIEPGSPYQRAGFEPGDILVTVQGVRVSGVGRIGDPLADALARAVPGTTVKMTILRRGSPGLLTLRAPKRQAK